MRDIKSGLYFLHWVDGGKSMAAVGMLYDGSNWFAPTNWTSHTKYGIASTSWEKVASVEPLLVPIPSIAERMLTYKVADEADEPLVVTGK